MPPISDLSSLLRSLEPALHEGVFVYSSVPAGTDLGGIEVVGTLREAEGITVIVREEEAQRAGLPILFRAAWITLTVHSDLEAVGLTAAFAAALGAAGISCNVVAGAYHDHLFVPVERAEEAMGVLRELHAKAG
ncbi:MAG TPA: ACT domain-containing protein [Thermoanaerobaculia bacterium]|nr:ACT domain-containing protein [Thermoanaerobaculia bacterium]